MTEPDGAIPAGGAGADALARALDAVVRGMGIEATVVVEQGDDESDLLARVDGEGTAALVGKGGETIDALQYLLCADREPRRGRRPAAASPSTPTATGRAAPPPSRTWPSRAARRRSSSVRRSSSTR